MKKTEWKKCYIISHPEHVTVPVIADNWEQATVEAAKFWGVPWARVAFDCTLESEHEARRSVCVRCGRIIFGKDGLCSACEKVLETQEQERNERLKKTWYLGKRRTAGG